MVASKIWDFGERFESDAFDSPHKGNLDFFFVIHNNTSRVIMKVPYYCGMRHKWGYGGNGIHADLRCLCFGMRVQVSLSPLKVIGYRLKPTQFLSECDITKTEPLTSVELWKTVYKEAGTFY